MASRELGGTLNVRESPLRLHGTGSRHRIPHYALRLSSQNPSYTPPVTNLQFIYPKCQLQTDFSKADKSDMADSHSENELERGSGARENDFEVIEVVLAGDE
ncbi:Alpha-Actinin-2 [Manis pentadactyla]|nr:Alpha-Actinin-2 [Manis pentadactyla]